MRGQPYSAKWGSASDASSISFFAVQAEDASHLPNKQHINPMPYQMMDGDARSAYESQSLQIRAELKKWEGDWAAARGGRKPGRDDIKQNADIGVFDLPSPRL